MREDGRRLPLLQLVPNLVTILGLCAGLTALRFAFAGRFEPAAALIILAAILDAFDGLIARRLDAASPFGAELDSLADFFNFGVAPAFLVYQMALTGAPDLGWTAALVFAVCACLRLARFNVSRDVPVTGRAHFVGVPAPAGAMLGLLPAFVTFAGIGDATAAPWLVAPWLAVVGLLMICRLRTFALKGLRVSRGGARWLLVGVALVVGLTFARFWLLMVLVDLAYLGSLGYALVVARRSRAAPAGE
jgi:CDP-diacylglycerol--serine O-phosphatidyltransferase